MSALDVTNLFPWKDIRDVTVDGEKMVFIPKVYVKNIVIDGFPAWYICGIQKEGYHLHPAFYNNGTPTQNGILIAKYLSSGFIGDLHSRENETAISLNFSDAESSIEAKNIQDGTSDQTGWHIYTLYEHHLLFRLALIEYGAPNFALKSSDSSELSFVYHGIVYRHVLCWVSGLRWFYDGTLRIWCILDKTQSQEINTDLEVISNGLSYFSTSVYTDSTEDYNLQDIFFGKNFIRNETKSLFGNNSKTVLALSTAKGYSLYPLVTGFGTCLAIYASMNSIGSTTSRYCRLAKFC